MTTLPNRRDVYFYSHGLKCHGWLYLPDSKKPAPVIVMGHGLGSVKTMRLPAYAERFCEAGYACLLFDYRHFGDSEGQPRQLLDIQKQLEDWQAAINFVRDSEDVDGTRIVLWGTSFGGGHAIAAAAADKRVSGVISQCPFTDGWASSMAINPISSMKIMPLAIADQIGAWLGAEPKYIATSGKPLSRALMTTPDALSGYFSLMPKDNSVKNYVAARIALNIMRYYPGRDAAKLNCPAFFAVCSTDSVAPSKATLRHVRKAPQGEIHIYEEGHFDIYLGEAFEKVVTDQLKFLLRIMPV
ncbi:hypothetical protein F892_00730 [Acinetobacter vivianii]|uniref:Serine aminopeptidase S33 domain-containing protein n=1 Tax=Acinetobacter vivianii TaxID=1776742 RepID=N9NKH8_9GAMM|nr:alpha/beta hydrolase [Acinetobacter vivianii]ENX21498.1 hypothetical protein F892_00730 [Acinetobacter vivianii]GGI61312.1 alpha/beta hydrolase [Acinetobacter vivianii]